MNTKIKRVKITRFEPKLDEGLIIFIKQWARKNHWKVSYLFDLEELEQQGMLIFCECREWYKYEFENQAHAVALFKQMLFTWLCTMSSKQSNRQHIHIEAPKHKEDESIAVDIPSLGQERLAVIIYQAPKHVKQVLNFLFNTPTEIMSAIEKEWESLGKQTMTDEFFQKHAGVPAGTKNAMKSYLQSSM